MHRSNPTVAKHDADHCRIDFCYWGTEQIFSWALQRSIQPLQKMSSLPWTNRVLVNPHQQNHHHRYLAFIFERVFFVLKCLVWSYYSQYVLKIIQSHWWQFVCPGDGSKPMDPKRKSSLRIYRSANPMIASWFHYLVRACVRCRGDFLENW